MCWVTAARNYFADADGLQGLISALLATLLWPLVLLDVDLDLGEDGRNRRSRGAVVPIGAVSWWLASRFGRRTTSERGDEAAA